ncbi:hypothetical protein D3C76_1861450 [compost metagenome]
MIGQFAVQLVDEELQVLIDFEALDGVCQQGRQQFLVDVHLAQRIFGEATDLEYLLTLSG